MKKIIYLSMACTLTLSSCEKESTFINPTEKQQKSEVEDMITQRNLGLCVCDGFVLTKSETGDFSCPGGTGCSKIVPCPCPVVASVDNNGYGIDLFVESHYDLYKKALVEHTLPQFFSTNKWVHIFPILRSETAILNQLKNGQLTMIEVPTSNGSLMQFCVSPNEIGDDINPNDVVFALEIPLGALTK